MHVPLRERNKQRIIQRIQEAAFELFRTDTHPSTLQALRFLFTRIYEHIFQFPEVVRALQALQQEILQPHPQSIDINKDTGFLDMIQTILWRGQQQGDVRSDIALEKLTRYVMVLYIAHVYELLEKNASPEYMLDIESLLEFLCSGLS